MVQTIPGKIKEIIDLAGGVVLGGFGSGPQPEPPGPLINYPVTVGSGTGTSSPITPQPGLGNTTTTIAQPVATGTSGFGAGPTPAISPVVLSVSGGDGSGTGSLVNPAQVDTLVANGVKLTPANVVATGTTPSGQIVFLETGNSASGLRHIVQEHAIDFANVGISEAQIPSVVIRAVTEGNIVGYQGSGTGRPIYTITVNGQPLRIAITVGSNGYIVGANPAGRNP